ncbi:MAG: exodeoxyribonuclease VII large subunit [Xanthomonadales bacterium]|nr:exodeoxyribonuclease VII large subunit [Xanthomonadales bacterium]
MDDSRTIYTPSELNREARLRLEAGFGRLWLEGEISNLSRPASGHLYFSLKDDRAQVRCALFRSQAAALSFEPRNGQQVQARGRVSIYEARGDFQMIAEHLEEAGEGRLRAAYEALKNKLKGEGLFDPANKQALPRFPARVAVITSPSGAVIRDIINVMERRWPLARLRLHPVPVQGTEAPFAIINALEAANRHSWADCIVLARGGGSLEDLHAFNDEAVARAVFASEIPVVSAVGHETDFSICDFVSDLRAPTPSAAAELIGPDIGQLRQEFIAMAVQLQRRISARLQGYGQSHDHLALRLLRQHPGRRLEEHHRALTRLRSRMSAHVGRLVPDGVQRVGGLRQRLLASTRRLVPERGLRLQQLARTLHAVSPLPTLERGYVIMTDTKTGKALKSIAKIEKQQAVSAQLKDGRVYAKVVRVSDERLPSCKEEPD